MPIARVETMLMRSPPAVQQLHPDAIAQRLADLVTHLAITPRQAAFMVLKQPAALLLTPLTALSAKLDELASALGVPRGAVLRAALTVPSILRRSTPVVCQRVAAYSALLRCGPLDVLHVLARGPEYLSDTPRSVRARMTALGFVLRRPRCTIAAMLRARPDLACMSAKVMNTKLNGLMSILNKQKRLVVPLVVAEPGLLRADLDRARAAFEGLQALLRKREGFAYAMVCHAPGLLLLSPRGLHQRAAALRRCLAVSPDWAGQFAQLRPPAVAQLLLNRRGSLSVMMFLAERQQPGRASLERLLGVAMATGRSVRYSGPEQVLGDMWPEFLAWAERRRAMAAARRQQRREAAVAAAGRLGQPAMAATAGLAVSAAGLSAGHPAQLLQPQLPVHRPPALGPEYQQPPSLPLHRAESSEHRAASSNGSAAYVALAAFSGRSTIAGSSHSNATIGSAGAHPMVGAQGEEQEALVRRTQQPGASTSGRQPSWFALQQEYRRSLQQARRRDETAAPNPGGVDSRSHRVVPPGSSSAGQIPGRSRQPALGARAAVAIVAVASSSSVGVAQGRALRTGGEQLEEAVQATGPGTEPGVACQLLAADELLPDLGSAADRGTLGPHPEAAVLAPLGGSRTGAGLSPSESQQSSRVLSSLLQPRQRRQLLPEQMVGQHHDSGSGADGRCNGVGHSAFHGGAGVPYAPAMHVQEDLGASRLTHTQQEALQASGQTQEVADLHLFGAHLQGSAGGFHEGGGLCGGAEPSERQRHVWLQGQQDGGRSGGDGSNGHNGGTLGATGGTGSSNRGEEVGCAASAEPINSHDASVVIVGGDGSLQDIVSLGRGQPARGIRVQRRGRGPAQGLEQRDAESVAGSGVPDLLQCEGLLEPAWKVAAPR